MVGPEPTEAPTVNVSLNDEVSLAPSVAVIVYVCVPSARKPIGPEKFTPDDAANGPNTPDTVVPSMASVEPVTPSGSAAFQLILPFDSDTTTWLIVGPEPDELMVKLSLTDEVLPN